ncbi:magnesium transporter mrs2-3 [Quercus suber]|uniref:Magnesium transporter mrs2-3 n=1 Tax=Quercus suber TaxID=58331 RepID=A0AAW0LX76_QUESU
MGLPTRDLQSWTRFSRTHQPCWDEKHIKAIITAQEVLLLNSHDPSVTPFVEEFQRRILRHHHATTAQEGNGDDSNWSNLYDLGEPQSRANSLGFHSFRIGDEDGKAEGKQGLDNQDGMKVLPFEFVALEACLEAACSCLENEVNIISF